MSSSVFWCDKRLFKEIIQKFGSNCKSYSVECIGNHHLKVTVDGEFDTFGAQRYCSINWDNTRWMLYRKGFEAYLMLDIDGLLKFIGKKGIGIRKFRKITGKQVFVVPIVFKSNLMFDIMTKS